MTVSEHSTLNSSKGIIRDRSLKGETEENILEYLKPQGVTAVKRFKIRKGELTHFQHDYFTKITQNFLPNDTC